MNFINLKEEIKNLYKKSQLSKDSSLADYLVMKWVHRFGIDSIGQLIKNASEFKEASSMNRIEEIKLEVEEKNDNRQIQEEIELEVEEKNVNHQNQEEIKLEIKNDQNLPLPSINNLRKWISIDINQEKKAS